MIAAVDSAVAPPWGAHAPGPALSALLRITRASARRGVGRTVSSAARNLGLSARRGPVDMETYGLKLRLYPRDNLADRRALFFPDHWEAMERAELMTAVRPDMTFIDAGANSGLYSLIVAKAAGRGARILAIEPQPGMKERLQTNIALNGYQDRIAHHDVALAEGDGEARLSVSTSNRGTSGLSEDGGVTVPTVGLADLIERAGVERVDAMKLDIEGAEDRVIPTFIERCPAERRPRLIVMETTAPNWAVDCVALLKDAGYREQAANARSVVLVLG